MKLLPSTALRSNGADFVRTYHHVSVDPDVTVEDLMTPGFWAHHANSLRVNDLVDVLAADGSLDCQLRVVGKGIGFVKMRPRMLWQSEERKPRKPAEPDSADEGDDLPELPEGYVVNFTPKTKWRVFTKEPHAEVSRDHATKRAAHDAALAHAAIATGKAAA